MAAELIWTPQARADLLYETKPDTDDGPIDIIEVVRVIDGRRDLRNLLAAQS